MDVKSFKHIDYPHNRYDPLKDEWILVCPHRSKRPWQGQMEKPENEQISERDAARNPLAPGVTRSNGEVNPNYTSTFVFDNDFPALIDDGKDNDDDDDDDRQDDSVLFRIKPARGRCRVICFHPKTNLSLPLMSVEEIIEVINTWIQEFSQMAKTYVWVQIFENRGAMMGCSNPHPHGQIWGSRFLPQQPAIKDRTQREYFQKNGRPMLWDYMEAEMKLPDERIVTVNDDWIVLVPFWAVWPFETMILPRQRQISRLDQLNDHEKCSLAKIMKQLLIKYDNLFQTSFPYSMAWHGAPTGPKQKDAGSHWILHAVYFPPLLRSATIKKFMVGYELAAQPQRDITAECAAETLRKLSGIQHYRNDDQ